MDMKASATASNKWRRLSCTDGSFHPQVTSCGLLPLNRQTLQRVSMAERKQSLPPNHVVTASSSPDYESGRGGGKSIVDANMPLLRKRLNTLRLQEERNNERYTPEEGSQRMQWEEELSRTYHSKICEAMRLLHNYLLYTRPSVALANLSIMAIVVATSVLSVMVLIVSNIHVCGFGAWILAISWYLLFSGSVCNVISYLWLIVGHFNRNNIILTGVSGVSVVSNNQFAA